MRQCPPILLSPHHSHVTDVRTVADDEVLAASAAFIPKAGLL